MVKVYVMKCSGCGNEYESVGEAVIRCPKCRYATRVVGTYTEGEGEKEV